VKRLEVKYLKGIYVDLDKDLESLEFMYNYREVASATAHKILKLDNLENTYEAQLEFSNDINNTIFWWAFNEHDNTFQELTSSGNLSILQNDTIKNGLLNLASKVKELEEQRDHMRRDYENYLYDEMFALDQFELVDFQELLETRDLSYLNNANSQQLQNMAIVGNQIISNRKIRNGLKLIILNNSYMLDLYDEMRDQIEKIQKEIDKELAL
jgi:hypothetical protein